MRGSAGRHSRCWCRARTAAWRAKGWRAPHRAEAALCGFAPAGIIGRRQRLGFGMNIPSLDPEAFRGEANRSTVMAEHARFALDSCVSRHVRLKSVLLSPHAETRSQSPRVLDVLATQKAASRALPSAAPEPLGNEPGASAIARDDRRPASGSGRRGLVATPRALELREKVGRLVEEAQSVLAVAGENST